MDLKRGERIIVAMYIVNIDFGGSDRERFRDMMQAAPGQDVAFMGAFFWVYFLFSIFFLFFLLAFLYLHSLCSFEVRFLLICTRRPFSALSFFFFSFHYNGVPLQQNSDGIVNLDVGIR